MLKNSIAKRKAIKALLKNTVYMENSALYRRLEDKLLKWSLADVESLALVLKCRDVGQSG